MCQDALNGSSRLRETRRASPPTHPTSSRPKLKTWVGPVARGAPPPHMGPYGPRKMQRQFVNQGRLSFGRARAGSHAGIIQTLDTVPASVG